MNIGEICQQLNCERFHVYLAIRNRIILADKDEVGRFSINQNQIRALSEWYEKLPKRKRKHREERVKKAYKQYEQEETKMDA